MSTYKQIDRICVAATVVTLLLTVFFLNGEALGISAIVSEDGSNGMFTANDLGADWDTSDASEIILSDDGNTVKGNGAYVYDGDIYIVYAGKYLISGELSDGSIIISADGDDKIWLMLDGVSLHCDDGAAIRVEQAAKVFLTLAGGTENTVSSGREYHADAVSAGVDGTIYSRDDLTINGNGALQVTAEYQHAIVCNDDLVIAGGSITAEAVQDGFHAHDSVRIRDADISITAGDDGITASNDEETAFLYIASGNIRIPSCYEGMEAIDITIDGGTIDIASSDDGINANGSGSSSAIHITGGDITIINTDGRDADGLDSNKDISISGGKIFISVADETGSSAIDYGTENGGICEISGGTVLACGSSAMAEGFDAASPQGFLMYRTSAAAGTTVTLEDSDGNQLLSEEVPCSFSSAVISTPEMKAGDTCTITIGESKEEVTIDNSASSADFRQTGNFGSGMQDRNHFGGRKDRVLPDQADETGKGGMPPELPDGADGDGTLQDDWKPGGQSNENGGSLGRPDEAGDKGNRDRRSLGSQQIEADDPLSADNLLLLGISAGILLFGLILACCFKSRVW